MSLATRKTEVLRFQKGLNRRTSIVDKCIELVAEAGAAGLTYESLAQSLKISKPHIKYYFSSKEDLLAACFLTVAEAGQKTTAECVAKAKNKKERLKGVVDGAFEWIKHHPTHSPILLLYYHYCAVNPKLAELQNNARIIGRERLKQILSEGRGPSSTTDSIAFDIQAYLTAVILEMLTCNDQKRASYYKTRVLDFISDRVKD